MISKLAIQCILFHSRAFGSPLIFLLLWLLWRYMVNVKLQIRFCNIYYNILYQNILQHNTIHYNTIQYSRVQYNTIQHNAIQCNTIQYNMSNYKINQYNKTHLKKHIVQSFKSWMAVRRQLDVFYVSWGCRYVPSNFHVSKASQWSRRNCRGLI